MIEKLILMFFMFSGQDTHFSYFVTTLMFPKITSGKLLLSRNLQKKQIFVPKVISVMFVITGLQSKTSFLLYPALFILDPLRGL